MKFTNNIERRDNMVKCEVIEKFTLKEFDKLKNIERASNIGKYGELNPRDTFECDEEMAKYLTGDNALNKVVVKVIEVEPKEVEQTPLEQWAVTEEEDGNVHVRPVVDGEIVDTPVEKVEDYSKKNKKKKSSKK